MIDAKKYDEEIDILNNGSSLEVIKKLFDSEIEIPSYYNITHKIIKRSPGQFQKAKITCIDSRETFPEKGFVLSPHIQVKTIDGKTKLLDTYQGVDLAVEGNESTLDNYGYQQNQVNKIEGSTYEMPMMYADILSSRVDKLNEQMGINQDMSDEEKR